MNDNKQTFTLLFLVFLAVGAMFVAYQWQQPALLVPWPQQPPPQVPPPWTPPPAVIPPAPITVEQAINSITEAELKEYVYKLADDAWEGRMSGKKGNVAAAAWIKAHHEQNGLPTMYDRFNIRRLNPGPHNERGDDFTQNVYAWIEGSELPDEVVVVGAHLDHIGYGPSMSRASSRREIHNGADDNASGTAVVMEVAEAMARLRPKRTVVFQSYSAEEMGLIGARHYCNNPTFPRNGPSIRKHVFMLNLDMVGYLGRGVYFAGFYEGNSSIDISRHIDELNQKYSFAKRITSRRGGGSDHACFYNKQVPVAFLHTGSHRWYHTPDDTADKINYPGMEKVARYAFELAWRVANDSSRPRFNYAEFSPLPYVHDHGHPGVPFYIHSYHHAGSTELPTKLRAPDLVDYREDKDWE